MKHCVSIVLLFVPSSIFQYAQHICHTIKSKVYHFALQLGLLISHESPGAKFKVRL